MRSSINNEVLVAGMIDTIPYNSVPTDNLDLLMTRRASKDEKGES
jgi:hypothetical protein